MTKEEKQLLLNELCMRLPSKVICRTRKEYSSVVGKAPIEGLLVGVSYDTQEVTLACLPLTKRKKYTFPVEEVIPYLRPLSSMTQDEQDELFDWGFKYRCGEYGVTIESGQGLDMFDNVTNYTMDSNDAVWLVNWLIKNRFDHNDLYEKGLSVQPSKKLYKS